MGNRLSTTTVGGATDTYSTGGNGYDAHGNLLKMPQLQALQWDFKDRLQMTQRQAVNAQDTDGTQHQGERTYYLYDASGNRVAKATESSLGVLVKLRAYLGGFEIYREFGPGATPTLERQTLHAMDAARRISLIEMRTLGNDGTPAQLGRAQFTNLIGSACLELDDQAQVISYEEYYPFGSTAYQAVNGAIAPAAKRYRFTGMERDEESGLDCHGVRYYAAWLGRWASADPAGLVDGPNLYRYARNAPTRLIDPGGTDPQVPDKPKEEKAEEDPKPDDQQAQPQNTGNSASALVQPKGTATSEFTLQGYGSGGSPGAAGGGSFLYHYRYVLRKEFEVGLQLGFGGVGPGGTGTGVVNATLHLGKEYDQFNLKDKVLNIGGWTFGAGFVWGQNPTLTSTLFPDQLPEEVGGANPVASAQYARSIIWSDEQGKAVPHLHQKSELDANFGVTAQRYGAVNGVTVAGLVVPQLVVNYVFMDKPGDNWQTNIEATEAANIGLGGAIPDPGSKTPLSGPGLRSLPFSTTSRLALGFSKSIGDYAVTFGPYAQHEAVPNVAASGGTGRFTDGAWTGGVYVDLTAINKPHSHDRP
jgi:RHS repeat-associated protein